MQTKILKVVKSGDVFSVKSEKSETGVLNKRNLVLKDITATDIYSLKK